MRKQNPARGAGAKKNENLPAHIHLYSEGAPVLDTMVEKMNYALTRLLLPPPGPEPECGFRKKKQNPGSTKLFVDSTGVKAGGGPPPNFSLATLA